jgi:transcriptional regulator with XRE-family HTH domain
MSGVSAPMVCRIESGEREPTYPILEKLAMALDLDDRERGTLYFDYNILPKRDPGAMKGVMDEIRFWFVE